MTERFDSATASGDDWLERVLRDDGGEHRAAYVAG